MKLKIGKSQNRPVAAQNEDGGALLEFAIAAPLFLILIFAILDFCLIYSRRNHLQQAVTGTAALVAKEPGDCGKQSDFAKITFTQYLTQLNSLNYAKSVEIGSSLVLGSSSVSVLDFIVEASLPCWTCPILFQGGFELPVSLSASPVMEVDRTCLKTKITL